MQRIPIAEIVFCHIHKQFHPSHVTVADPDSSDSGLFYPNDRYRYEHYAYVLFNTHKRFAQRA